MTQILFLSKSALNQNFVLFYGILFVFWWLDFHARYEDSSLEFKSSSCHWEIYMLDNKKVFWFFFRNIWLHWKRAVFQCRSLLSEHWSNAYFQNGQNCLKMVKKGIRVAIKTERKFMRGTEAYKLDSVPLILTRMGQNCSKPLGEALQGHPNI